MIVTYERLRDRVEAVLPDNEEFARSTWDLAIWLGATQTQIEDALKALLKFKAVRRKQDAIITESGCILRWMWWRA